MSPSHFPLSRAWLRGGAALGCSLVMACTFTSDLEETQREKNSFPTAKGGAGGSAGSGGTAGGSINLGGVGGATAGSAGSGGKADAGGAAGDGGTGGT